MSNNIITKAATSLFLLGTLSVSAAGFSPWAGNTSAAQSPLRFHPRVLENTFSPKAVDKDGNMVPDDVHIVSYHKTNNTAGVVTGPNGEDWFYTLELDGEKLIENEYVTEYDYHTFHVRIYDEKLNFVGQAQGEVTRPEGTLRCQGIELGTQVTKSFFNSNASDYEIMVTSNFNPAPVEGVARYGAKQTTEAYSLTAEIPEGGSKCLFAQPGYAISMINTGNSISENFLIALSEETSWDGEDKEHVNYTVYKKAGWGTPAEKVTSFNIDLKLAYSDGINETIPFVMTTKGNDVYIATALYEKTFLDDPTASDPTLAKDNNYVITLYKASGNEYTQVAETKIPCVGGAKSPLWKKIIANVMNLKVDVIESEEGPALGGAMLAAVACGEYESVEAAAAKLVKVVDTVEPDPEIAAKYEKRYEQFRQIYPACKPLFEIIK